MSGACQRHRLFLVRNEIQPTHPPSPVAPSQDPLAEADTGAARSRFEAFDEPWKVVYNTPGKEWEDQWGLMGIDRKLKAGLRIPDCGGRTI